MGLGFFLQYYFLLYPFKNKIFIYLNFYILDAKILQPDTCSNIRFPYSITFGIRAMTIYVCYSLRRAKLKHIKHNLTYIMCVGYHFYLMKCNMYTMC